MAARHVRVIWLATLPSPRKGTGIRQTHVAADPSFRAALRAHSKGAPGEAPWRGPYTNGRREKSGTKPEGRRFRDRMASNLPSWESVKPVPRIGKALLGVWLVACQAEMSYRAAGTSSAAVPAYEELATISERSDWRDANGHALGHNVWLGQEGHDVWALRVGDQTDVVYGPDHLCWVGSESYASVIQCLPLIRKLPPSLKNGVTVAQAPSSEQIALTSDAVFWRYMKPRTDNCGTSWTDYVIRRALWSNVTFDARRP
jgi:hypothetical protein